MAPRHERMRPRRPFVASGDCLIVEYLAALVLGMRVAEHAGSGDGLYNHSGAGFGYGEAYGKADGDGALRAFETDLLDDHGYGDGDTDYGLGDGNGKGVRVNGEPG